MNKLTTLLILAVFLSLGSVHAQTPTLKSYEKAAKKAMEDKNYYSAWKFYEIAIEVDSNRVHNRYNLAEATRLFKSYEIAQGAYEKVLASNEKMDYPLAEYYLAKVMHSQGNYDGAIKHYQGYLDQPEMTARGDEGVAVMKNKFKADAKKGIVDCKWAKEQTVKTSYKVNSFGKGVNTAGTEFAPVEYQSKVYYSALAYDKDNYCPDPNGEITRLYTSSYGKGGSQAEEIGQTSAVNWSKEEDKTFVAHTAFSTNGSRVYFTVCQRVNASELDCEIYYREKNNKAMWGDMVRLSEYINQLGTSSTQPNIGYDKNLEKELLFFVSDRSETDSTGRGDNNIFCSIIEADGKVSQPVKLAINTPEDDVTPFYDSNSSTLYFSSKGMSGYGGFDIYKAEKNGVGYAEAQALPQPLNSSYDDIYYSKDENSNSSYFSTNRWGVTFESEGMETCCNDIYKLDIIQVDLLANTFNKLAYDLNVESEKKLDSCNVILYDITEGKRVELSEKLDPEGNQYAFTIDLEKEYMVWTMREGRWSKDSTGTAGGRRISTIGLTESTTIERDLFLMPDVDLISNTYLKTIDGEKTDEPLLGCTFEFIDVETGNVIMTTERIDDNRFYQWLEFGKSYKVRGTKDGYEPDEAVFNTKDLYVSKTFIEPLYLKPSVDINLSVILYFDNDEPDKRTRARTTKRTYEQAYVEYVKEERIQKFITENSKGLEGEIKIQVETETNEFFEDEVKFGMQRLELFAKFLELYLPQGRVYEIVIVGSASPRAPAGYNKDLTYRRVNSVENYLKRYNEGILAPYIGADKSLRITLEPKGEEPSLKKKIPSQYSDPKSIYSIPASKERKVEIVKIKRIK